MAAGAASAIWSFSDAAWPGTANSGLDLDSTLVARCLGGPGEGSTLVADHLTVAHNEYDRSGHVVKSQGGGVYLESYSTATFTNSIFWSNGDEPFIGDPTCSVVMSYSIAPAACVGVRTCAIGAGVFQPLAVHFVDEPANDYHEKSTAGRFANGTLVTDDVTSPAVDRADPPEDVGAEPAPNGGRANHRREPHTCVAHRDG